MREHGPDRIGIGGAIREAIWPEHEHLEKPWVLDEVQQVTRSATAYVLRHRDKDSEVWIAKQRSRGRRGGLRKREAMHGRRDNLTWPMFDRGLSAAEALAECRTMGFPVARATVYRDAEAHRIAVHVARTRPDLRPKAKLLAFPVAS